MTSLPADFYPSLLNYAEWLDGDGLSWWERGFVTARDRRDAQSLRLTAMILMRLDEIEARLTERGERT